MILFPWHAEVAIVKPLPVEFLLVVLLLKGAGSLLGKKVVSTNCVSVIAIKSLLSSSVTL